MVRQRHNLYLYLNKRGGKTFERKHKHEIKHKDRCIKHNYLIVCHLHFQRVCQRKAKLKSRPIR